MIRKSLDKSRQYYLAAILLGLLFHGTVMAFTVENTYDAYVHMFFGGHYAETWFETWNYKWYTGFTMTSYPPLVHQIIAILSKVVGLKMAFITWGMIMVLLFVRGVYHFSQIWVDRVSAGYAALLAVISSSFIEALHVFGQLPSLTGIALLLNACPELYRWIKEEDRFRFFTGVTIVASVTAAHHVSTIFGMVFFVAPVLGVAVLDKCIIAQGGIEHVSLKDFIQEVWKLFPKAIRLGLTVILLTVVIIFPYWYWSKTDPISQVSIPHGSRANFLKQQNLGLVFFLIPWGAMLFFLPGLFVRMFKKRNIFLGLSFALAFLLGTGGTTPIPKMILGETAFNILTLDRFTFWASVMALPFFGSLIYSLSEGKLKGFIVDRFSQRLHKVILFFTITGMLASSALIINISSFRPLQPDPIDPIPIANFMDRDGHNEWRYLTLGFGDQVAWLAAHTRALSVDGNYHSARRLPELTTRAVERLENAKYLGMEGLGALQQFLGVPEKYHLKYIFSNDKFYEPMLYFYGWTKLSSLENNIDVWERKDVLPLPAILPKKDIPRVQKIMWGVLPLTCLLLAFIFNFYGRRKRMSSAAIPDYHSKSKGLYYFYSFWFIIMLGVGLFLLVSIWNKQNPHKSPDQLLQAYFHKIDFKYFEEAHKLFDPETKPSIEQFLLELSLEDGLLASYAKLDKIEIKPISDLMNGKQEFMVQAHWLTAVKAYQTTHHFELLKKDKKWFLLKEPTEKKIPADQFLRLAEVDFFNQGRRKATTSTTIREDILDRPEIYINESHLVKKESNYSIIGSLINVDNDPAFITIDATLFDAENREIITYAVSDQIIHNLMPKEQTVFRIDFEDIFWQQTKSQFPEKFDPELDGSYELDRIPVTFTLNVRTMVTDERLYKFYGVEHHKVNNRIVGSIVNYGNQELAIPQLLIAQRDQERLKWVSAHYLPKGVRPQRSKDFSIDLVDVKKIKLIQSGTDKNLLVNAVSRSGMKASLPENYSDDMVEDDYFIQVNSLVNFKN